MNALACFAWQRANQHSIHGYQAITLTDNSDWKYQLRDLPWLIGTAVLYALFAKTVLTLYSANGMVTIFWPGAGLSLAALLLGGRKFWISIYAGAFAGAAWHGQAYPIAGLIAIGSTLEPLIGVWLLRRKGGFDTTLRSARDVFSLFALAATLSPAVCALLGIGTLRYFESISAEAYWQSLAVWWMGDTLGIVLVTPLILVWRHPPRISRSQLVEGFLVAGVTFIFGQIIFLDWLHGWFGHLNRGYWMYLFVTWAAIRMGAHGVILILLITTIQALIGATHEAGFFGNDLARTQLTNFWAYTMTLSTVGMLLATIFAEQRMTELSLHQSERDLREAQKLSGLGGWWWDIRSDIHRWSEEVYRIYGRDPGLPAAIYPEVSKYFTPQSWDRLSATVETALSQGQAYECDAEVIRPDGSRRWIVARGEAVRDDDGSIAVLRGTIQDITERKRIEIALAESEAQYRAVIETASDGFWMVDARGRILAANEAYVRRSGYSRDELVTMNIADLDANESEAEVRTHVKKIKATGRDLFETRHIAKNGEVWAVEINATYWQDAGGHFFVFMRDLTERKQTEATLQAWNAEMEKIMHHHVARQTIAAITHELNQPLVAVSSYAAAALRLLRAGNPQPDKLMYAVEHSAEQAQRAGQVARQLMSYLNHEEIKFETFDLNALTHKVVHGIDKDHRGEFTARLELDPALPPVSANRMQIEKILANLIENGIEAMHTAGNSIREVVVTVCTHADSRMAQVTVSDNGPGIDEQIRHRIFDPFFTTKKRGLGMGLPISRAIIETHGGQLWLESAPGPGASFHFTLPLAP